MKERIMLDPRKVLAHSDAIMENNPHSRPYTKHLMMESGLTSAQLEGYTHVSPEEADELADLLGCGKGDIIAGTYERMTAPTVASSPAAPTAPAASGHVCSRKECVNDALPGKKICKFHMDIVMAGKNRTTTAAECDTTNTPTVPVEVSVAEETAPETPMATGDFFTPAPFIPADTPRVTYGPTEDIAAMARRIIDKALASANEIEMRKLRLELHAALLGNLASALLYLGADKEEILGIVDRAQSLAEELAGVR